MSGQQSPGLEVVVDGPVAHVWLDRPERRNAFDGDLIVALGDAFERLGAESAVRCIVLAGRGAAFSAGADVGWMRASLELTHADNVADAERLAAMLQAIDSCPKPTVARVHGAALGGGAGLVACCDIAIAAVDARFGFTEVRLGLIPATIAPFALAKIGLSHARALFLSGAIFGAERAREIGLVHQVAADETALDAAVAATVAELVAAAPRAVEHAKRFLYEVAGHDPAALRRSTAEAIAGRRASAEAQEGLRAFLDRRDPAWRQT